MTGIAYPVAAPGDRSCLCMWHGDEDDDLEPLLRYVNYDVLGFPEADNLVHIVGVNERNSDESSWDALGYKSLRWAGMRAASDYPAYHMPDDTMETIDSEMPVARAAANGSRPVRLDASGSTDPDGTPSAFEWDFGDGSSGSGLTITHSYARSGDYTATLTVRDNLHPQVTSSSTVFVRADGAAKKAVAKKKACAKKKTKKARKRCRRKRARRA